MPATSWCLANIDRIRWSQQWVAKRLEPVDPDTLDRMLAALVATTGHESGERADTWEVVRKEYHRLLGHYSASVWVYAIDEHRRRSKFFPTIAELEALMKSKTDELRVSDYRLRKMLEAKPESQEPAGKRYDELTDAERAALDAKVAEVMRNLNANREVA